MPGKPRKRTASQRSKRAVLGLIGTLLVWVLAGAHLGSTLHFALVSHRVCPAHGELEHGDAHAAEPHAEAAHEALALTAAEDVEHDHCELFARPKDDVTRPAFAVSEAVAPLRVGEPGPVLELVVPGRAGVLLVAPKQSPPV